MGVDGCSNTISVWTLGMAGECFNPQAGFRIGKGGITRVSLQVNSLLSQHLSRLYSASTSKTHKMNSFSLTLTLYCLIKTQPDTYMGECINNNGLYMAPHLGRAHSTYKGIRIMLISSHTHTHARAHTHTHARTRTLVLCSHSSSVMTCSLSTTCL